MKFSPSILGFFSPKNREKNPYNSTPVDRWCPKAAKNAESGGRPTVILVVSAQLVDGSSGS